MKRKPSVYIIAGPNGAGKTTFAFGYLKTLRRKHEFINADEIARAMSPEAEDKVAFAAGKEMIRLIRRAIRARKDFAFESTLSGTIYLRLLKDLRKSGYEIRMVYLWVRRVNLAVSRVKQRVASGGHHVPKDVVIRRYHKGLRNFWHSYRPLADSISIFDNSEVRNPHLIAVEEAGTLDVLDSEAYEVFRRRISSHD